MSDYWPVKARAIRNLPMQDNAASLVVADLSPAADATLTNGVSTAAARVAGPTAWLPGALSLDGVNDRITIASVTDNELTRPFLLASWVKSAAGGPNPIFGAFSGSFKIENNTQVILFTPTPSFSFVSFTVTGIANLRDGVWRHYAVLVSGSSASLYIDGVLRGTQSLSPGRTWNYSFIGQTESAYRAMAFADAAIVPSATAADVASLLAGPEPTNTVLPVVTAAEATLSSTTGTWEAHLNGSLTYAYQWQSYSGSWANISGATASSYAAPAAGLYRCNVTATNNGGPSVAASSEGFFYAPGSESNTPFRRAVRSAFSSAFRSITV